MIVLIGLATAACTALGGMFALRFKDKLHLVLGFSAGAVLGVAFFDLLPEALGLASPRYGDLGTLVAVAVGFLSLLFLNGWAPVSSHDDDDCENPHHKVPSLGAASLVVHSFLDGLGIGLAFKVSPAVGVIVAVAVLVHDFSDGINTVSFVLKDGSGGRTAAHWLWADALAPLVGIGAASLLTPTNTQLGIVLAVFSGFFLYIGASDLVPESHHRHPGFFTGFMTIAGVAVMYWAIRLASL